MFDDRLRNTKETIFIQIARLFGLFVIPPAWLTAVALFIGLLCAVALAFGQLWLGFLLWVFNRIFDGLDGTVARIKQNQTDLGGYLDILGDFATYALVPIGLVIGQPSIPNFIALSFLLGSFYVNAASWMYLSAILEKRMQGKKDKKTSVTMPSGLVGGVETMIFYGAFILFPQWLVALFATMSILVVITVVQRLIWATRQLEP